MADDYLPARDIAEAKEIIARLGGCPVLISPEVNGTFGTLPSVVWNPSELDDECVDDGSGRKKLMRHGLFYRAEWRDGTRHRVGIRKIWDAAVFRP